MVGFLRLCQHFAKKKREMEREAANMAAPPPRGQGKAQTVVVRSSAEKSRRRPPKIDQSVQCSDMQQQSVQQSGQQSRVDVSEEEERELEKRLLKLQGLIEESNQNLESDSEDDFDAEIESALEGVDREIAERSERTDLVVVSSETATVLSVDATLPVAPSDSESGTVSSKGTSTSLKCKHCFCKRRENQLITFGFLENKT